LTKVIRVVGFPHGTGGDADNRQGDKAAAFRRVGLPVLELREGSLMKRVGEKQASQTSIMRDVRRVAAQDPDVVANLARDLLEHHVAVLAESELKFLESIAAEGVRPLISERLLDMLFGLLDRAETYSPRRPAAAYASVAAERDLSAESRMTRP
jgi:hypothetical protein